MANLSYTFQESFTFFWETAVQPIIERVYKEVDEDFSSKCNFDYSFENMEDFKNKVMSFYKRKRAWLKQIYLPHQEKPILDMHKLGAVLCRSLLANKPFYFDFTKAEEYVSEKFANDKTQNNTQWFIDNIYANYKVAFYASVGWVYLELLYTSKTQGDMDAFNFFLEQKALAFYPYDANKVPVHENFQNSCILALQKNDSLNRDFDYLSFAILLYQLEQFNKIKYKNKF